MSKIQDAIALAKQWAADNSHGYDQTNRWGPDYDCSSFLISVWEAVGVPVKTNGATWTGNMKDVFCRCGFEVVTTDPGELIIGAGLRDGDIVLNNENHVAMLVDGYRLVQASINEKGTANGGQTGDQTGREISIVNWYSFPWNCALRYVETTETQEVKNDMYTVKPGDSWWGIAQNELGDGSRMYELAALNGKTIGSMIHPGDILLLRESGSADPNVARKVELELEVAKLGGKIIWQ